MRVSLQNRSAIKVERALLLKSIKAVLTGEGAERPPCLVIVGDEEMIELHERFLQCAGTTDTMAFPSEDEDESLGDVIVNVEEAKRSAKSHGFTWMQELCLYAIHGCLHLCGYEDKTAVGKRDMRKMEKRYLAEVGF